MSNADWDLIALHNGMIIKTHSPAKCVGAICCIHNPSQHHMATWSLNWRGDRGTMERMCSHGVGHPDPDDYKILMGIESGDHGCDGCCRK